MGGTKTGEALMKAREILDSGARNGVPHLVVVITDGLSDAPDLTSQEAQHLHDTGTIVFAVGIGTSVDEDELASIASSEEYVFQVDSFEALYSIRHLLAITACSIKYQEEEAEEEGDTLPVTTKGDY